MTLTLLALLLIPLYLKIVLDPKGSYKLFKKISKSETAQFGMAIWLMTLSLLILSSTGLNFAWEWDSLLAWIGLITGIKGVFYLIPDMLEKRMKLFHGFFKPELMPFLGFLGLVLALALVYLDTQVLA